MFGIKTKVKKVLKKLFGKCKLYLLVINKYNRLKSCVEYKKVLRQYGMMENLVFFEAMLGKMYGCNPKAIYKSIREDVNYRNFRFVWSFNKPNNYKNLKKEDSRLTIVKHGSQEYKIALARARYIFSSSGLPYYFKTRKGQVYFQTWHGTPLKKLGCEIEIEGNANSSLRAIHRRYQNDAKQMNYLLAPSEFAAQRLSAAFALPKLNRENIILKEGYPRNDILFKITPDLVEKIKKTIGLENNKKIILYAPTFRDSDFSKDKGYFFELPFSLERFKKEFGEDGVLLLRLHPLVSDKLDIKNYADFVLDVSEYEDVMELCAISDLLITDYSSVLFDFANLKRPMLFYMFDLERYKNEVRGLSLELEELPGPIIENEEDLYSAISELLNHFEYDDKYKKFNKKFNPWDSENCSYKIISRIVSKN